ncbi:MAG: hypothetical protein RBU24_05710 [Kiritimatiellia bacterium]|jgi:hypothetical protein|nr:hypothetical protein [Kiritimatiellia bacterium]
MSAVGWFPLSRQDIETLLDYAGEKNYPSLIAVWCACLSLANAGGSCELTVPVNAIARAAGLTYKPAHAALHYLSGIGLLTIEERYGTDRRNREPSKYTLKASVSPCGVTPQPLGHNSPRVVESGRRLMTENNTNNSSNEENKVTKREASDAAGKLTPENFSERAQAANADRLTAPQLASFCDYWTERNARGRCRFESEKFFELTKRITTWASRERVASIPSAAPAAVKPERPIWVDCARRCRHWDDEKRWCQKYVKTEPKSCDHCREF